VSQRPSPSIEGMPKRLRPLVLAQSSVTHTVRHTLWLVQLLMGLSRPTHTLISKTVTTQSPLSNTRPSFVASRFGTLRPIVPTRTS
jgi:hypothetical protein